MNYGRGDGRIIFCYALLVCFILSACSKRSAQNKYNNDNQQHCSFQSMILERVIQQEAMLVNIPLPLYDERILPVSYDDDASFIKLGYKSPLSLQQAIDFFMNQMERYGWRHLVSFEGQESILQFENPDCYCTVVITSLEKNCSSVFIYMKRAST
jgi:hypothetical protein